MSYKFETIAIEHETGNVSRLQMVMEAPASAFDANGAQTAGFVFDNVTQHWTRSLNPGLIQREIARSSFGRAAAGLPVGRPVRWKRVLATDFPAVRNDYNATPER